MLYLIFIPTGLGICKPFQDCPDFHLTYFKCQKHSYSYFIILIEAIFTDPDFATN